MALAVAKRTCWPRILTSTLAASLASYLILQFQRLKQGITMGFVSCRSCVWIRWSSKSQTNLTDCARVSKKAVVCKSQTIKAQEIILSPMWILQRLTSNAWWCLRRPQAYYWSMDQQLGTTCKPTGTRCLWLRTTNYQLAGRELLACRSHASVALDAQSLRKSSNRRSCWTIKR